MSKIKIVEDLLLEKAELNKMLGFITTEGYEYKMLQDAESYGVIRNEYIDPTNKFLKVQTSQTLGTAKLNPGVAYDKNGNRILVSDAITMPIPEDGNWYWIKINHVFTSLEVGTVNIGGINRGLLSGTGTKFTEVLRGQPNFPVRITFVGGSYNDQYEVLEVIDDENALIQGVFEQLETNMQYVVVGTFTAGKYPAISDERIYQYDSVKYEVVLEQANGIVPAYTKDVDFFIARLRNNGGNLEIQDKRYTCQFKTRAEALQGEIESKPNPLIAVESIKKLNFNGEDIYSVNYDWKFNIGTANINSTTDIAVINSGYGGKYKSINNFNDGDFDGWRYYYANGDFSKILRSFKNSDDTISVLLDVAKVDAKGNSICPDADNISIEFNFENVTNQPYARDFRTYPINKENPTAIFNSSNLSKINQFCDLKYSYNTNKISSQIFEFNSNEYLIEKAFDKFGNLVDDTKTLIAQDLYFNGGVDYGYLDGWIAFAPNEYKLLYGSTFSTIDPQYINSNIKYKLFGANTVRIQGRLSFSLGTDQSANNGLAPNGISFKTPFTWVDDSAVNNVCRSWINSISYLTGAANSRKYELIRTETLYNGSTGSIVEDGTPSDNIACRYIKEGKGILSDLTATPPFTVYDNPLPTATVMIMDIDILTYFSAQDLTYVNGQNGDDNLIQQGGGIGGSGLPKLANYTIVGGRGAGGGNSVLITVSRSSIEQNFKVKVTFHVKAHRSALFGGDTDADGSLTMDVLSLVTQTTILTPHNWDYLKRVYITGIELL
jgi:hypothetical protein